ncbi:MULTISPECIES: flagellar motor switch protein [Carnobacterium]|uniref:flagellar motor switch protein n=1 Tax=Carnobacterium TaxID=2747 RepID=UPI00203FBF37|nr:flagellar motor switch protein [Carnobacterium inhibens]MCM3511878.1 flagellar motor switch protein [Carnobacterium inhibens]
MNKKVNALDTLVQFKTLLMDEQQALIQNDSAKVKTLIEQKQQFLDLLPTLTAEGSKKEDLVELAEEIKNLQQTNLTLTEQALNYQETMMEAITKGVNAGGSTYSKQGDYSTVQQANIIDQSL